MAVMSYTDNSNKPFYLGGGDRVTRGQETFAQDAGRSTALAPFTVVAKNSAGTWTPLSDVDPALSSAYLTCGALAGNLAAWQAVTDGEFAITVDGIAIDVTGLDFSGIAALTEIPAVINSDAAVTGVFKVVDVDGVAGSMRIESLKQGTPNSSITVTSAVSGGTGTDISAGTTGLNGADGTGTVTAATGDLYTTIPAGIYIGTSIAAASLVAGTVTKKQVLVGGFPVYVDKNQLVFENSQALTSVVKVNGINKTIEDYLVQNLGIIAIDAVAMDAQEND